MASGAVASSRINYNFNGVRFHARTVEEYRQAKRIDTIYSFAEGFLILVTGVVFVFGGLFCLFRGKNDSL